MLLLLVAHFGGQNRHCAFLSVPSKVGGFAGDSQGIRWGFEGDSQAIRGIRSKNACVCREFQGDSLETTNPFYNIKRGEGIGTWLFLWLALTRTVFPLPTLLCVSHLALRFADFQKRSFASRNL